MNVLYARVLALGRLRVSRSFSLKVFLCKLRAFLIAARYMVSSLFVLLGLYRMVIEEYWIKLTI